MFKNSLYYFRYLFVFWGFFFFFLLFLLWVVVFFSRHCSYFLLWVQILVAEQYSQFCFVHSTSIHLTLMPLSLPLPWWKWESVREAITSRQYLNTFKKKRKNIFFKFGERGPPLDYSFRRIILSEINYGHRIFQWENLVTMEITSNISKAKSISVVILEKKQRLNTFLFTRGRIWFSFWHMHLQVFNFNKSCVKICCSSLWVFFFSDLPPNWF